MTPKSFLRCFGWRDVKSVVGHQLQEAAAFWQDFFMLAQLVFKAAQCVAFEHLDNPPATSKARWLPLASVIDCGRRAHPSDNRPYNYNQCCLPAQLSQQGPEMNKNNHSVIN